MYTNAGRRMFPAMKLSAPAAIVSSDGAWRLLAVCRDGSLHIWDLQTLTSLLQASLQPLLACTPSGTAGTTLLPALRHPNYLMSPLCNTSSGHKSLNSTACSSAANMTDHHCKPIVTSIY